MTLRLRVGEEQTKLLQQYSSLVHVVSTAFGGSTQAPQVDESLIPQTAEEAVMRFRSLFS